MGFCGVQLCLPFIFSIYDPKQANVNMCQSLHLKEEKWQNHMEIHAGST